MIDDKPTTTVHTRSSGVSQLTLKPPDLCGGSVTFLITSSYSEDDGRFGCVIYVSGG